MKPALFAGHTRVFSRAALSSVSTKREIPCIGGDNGLTQQRGSRAPKEPECTTGLAQRGNHPDKKWAIPSPTFTKRPVRLLLTV